MESAACWGRIYHHIIIQHATAAAAAVVAVDDDGLNSPYLVTGALRRIAYCNINTVSLFLMQDAKRSWELPS